MAQVLANGLTGKVSMKKSHLIVLAASLGLIMTCINKSHAAFVLSGGSTQTLPLSGNDFDSELQGLGYSQMTTGAQLSIDQDGFVTFTYIGAESAFNNSFNTSSGSMTEAGDAFNFNGFDSLTINVLAGDVLNFNFTSDDVGRCFLTIII